MSDVGTPSNSGCFAAFRDFCRKGEIESAAAIWEMEGEAVLRVNHRNPSGIAALHYAAGAGQVKVLKFLLDTCAAKIDLPSKYSDTALILAATNNRQNCVRSLLKRGADPSICGNGGKTALERAKARSFTDIVAIFEEFVPTVKSALKT